MTFRTLPLLLATLGLTLTACGDKDGGTDTGAAGTECSDPDYNPMAGTCVYDFMADCFDPSGECTGTVDGTTGESTFTWDNGATVETTVDYSDPQNILVVTTLTSSSGALCATGETVSSPQGECFSTTTYTRESDGAEQVWCIQADGSYEVTCPGGETVSVSAAQATAANECAYGEGDAGACETDVSGYDY